MQATLDLAPRDGLLVSVKTRAGGEGRRDQSSRRDELQAHRLHRAWSVEENDPGLQQQQQQQMIHTPSVIRALVIEQNVTAIGSEGDETSVSDSGSD